MTFDEPVRKIDDSAITPGDLLTLVELKLTNDAGATVPFTASINGGSNIITIDPTAVLSGNTVYYVEINPVEDASNNAIVASNITFTTGDTQAPIITFSPTDNATDFSAVGNVVITFNEPIRKTDDTPITPADIEGGLIEFKLTNDAGAAVPFTATINGTNTMITLNPNSTLLHNQLFYIEVNPVEDVVNNATIAQNIDFTTEDRPSISAFVPAAAERCIGDPVTINGLRFTGTGNPTTGNTQPTVYVNGVAVPALNVTLFNDTQVIFTLPSMTPGNYPITIRNNDSDLLSAGSNFDVLPAIDQTLTVTPATFNPAQNTNVDVTVSTTQSAAYSYALILETAPGGYSVVPPATVHSAAGNNGSLILNTAEGADPDLTHIGSYQYRIDVLRTNCVTKTLNNTPFSLTVASLAVNVTTTDVDNQVCNGSSITLIGAASGGTGFYQFRWTSTPAGFASTESSPTVSPTSNIRYNLELEDNAGNIVNDFVDIVINPLPVADIVPNAGETAVRTNYVVENRDYLITGSPAGGVFSGQGVILKSDGFYYFNPLNAGVNTIGWPIVYTYTDGNGCSDQDTENFKVNTAAINNLDLSYCRNSAPTTPLTTVVNLSPNSSFPTYDAISNPSGWQFTRLVFYRQLRNSPYTYCIAEVAPTFPYCGLPNPLTVTATTPVLDIQTGLPFNQPTAYTLDLDVIRNNYGYSTDNYFYILAYGKNTSGTETYITFQYFDLYDNNPAPSIVGINQNENICADALPISLTSSEPAYTITGFTITPGGFAGALSGTNNKDFDPGYSGFAGADERPLAIQMAYNDFNNCPNAVTRNFNWVKKPNSPIANDSSFCQFGDPSTFKLKARKSGSADNTFWYDDTMVEQASGTFIFDVPGIDGLTPDTEDFFVSQSYKGCEGDPTGVTVFINPAPNATITRDPICEDRDFLLTGPEESPGVPYNQYDWTFGDGQSISVLSNNTTTYNYGPGSALAPFTIGLTVTTSLGCKNTSTLGINVGPNPKPDFTYKFVCENDATVFNGSTDIPVTEYEWDFGDLTLIPKSASSNPAPEGGTIEDPVHTFSNGVGNYSIKVTSYTASGCFNSKTKAVSILEYLTHTSATPYDMASVDGGQGYWKLEDVASNSTWVFAQPTTTLMDDFTSPAWVTNAAGNYSPGEYSFVNSPCLDIMNIDRPVLSFDFIMNTDENRDGLVMEYSKDGGVTWLPLGGPNSGFNWFNTNGFITGTIGNSTVGWSGDSWELADNIQHDTLVQARRALDNLPNLSLADRQKVRFRIAFKTDNARELDGFGFNNLTIASRNRILLVENFTNEGDNTYAANNAEFKNISVAEAVKIQYHVAAPSGATNGDTNYPINTADPSARAAYYGIPLTDQAIPRGYVDGLSNGNFTATAWVQNQFSQRALKVAPFNLTIGTTASSDPTYIKVNVTITALENIPRAKNPVLLIGLVEKTVGSNEYVLRKMIPTAAGRMLTVPMAQGAVVNIIDSVRIENPDIVISQLAVVAFIQDQVTREVYQSNIDMNPTNLPTATITGVEQPDYADKINLFPNPTNQELHIQLPTAVARTTPLRVIDTNGRTVIEDSFAPGQSSKVINTSELNDGVYIIQISIPEGKNARRKVMVIHR
ncbi:MAG TPA: T9SS type A sorting domain-containing protein [Cyclobacteriaceae bacterium]|nr:T9SS type A sorting domain-containing protein [Cyclobacteriaceae bacterium]